MVSECWVLIMVGGTNFDNSRYQAPDLKRDTNTPRTKRRQSAVSQNQLSTDGLTADRSQRSIVSRSFANLNRSMLNEFKFSISYRCHSRLLKSRWCIGVWRYRTRLAGIAARYLSRASARLRRETSRKHRPTLRRVVNPCTARDGKPVVGMRPAGVENANAIAAVDRIDVLWIGHFDLSNSLAVPGQFDHPRIGDALGVVLAACRQHRKVPGFMAGSIDNGESLLDQGFRMLAYGGDLWLYAQAVPVGVVALNTHVGNVRPKVVKYLRCPAARNASAATNRR